MNFPYITCFNAPIMQIFSNAFEFSWKIGRLWSKPKTNKKRVNSIEVSKSDSKSQNSTYKGFNSTMVYESD